MLRNRKLIVNFKKKINIYLLPYFSAANHPCKHLGTGLGVTNSVLPISLNVFAQRIISPTLFVKLLPHTMEASTTPSSSDFINDH